jgi:hypothetical protein
MKVDVRCASLDTPTDIFFALQEKVYSVCNAESDTTQLRRHKKRGPKSMGLMAYFDGLLSGENALFMFINGGDC